MCITRVPHVQQRHNNNNNNDNNKLVGYKITASTTDVCPVSGQLVASSGYGWSNLKQYEKYFQACRFSIPSEFHQNQTTPSCKSCVYWHQTERHRTDNGTMQYAVINNNKTKRHTLSYTIFLSVISCCKLVSWLRARDQTVQPKIYQAGPRLV